MKYFVEVFSRSQQKFEIDTEEPRVALLKVLRYMDENNYLDPRREEIVSFIVSDDTGKLYFQAPVTGFEIKDDNDYQLKEVLDEVDEIVSARLLEQIDDPDDDF